MRALAAALAAGLAAGCTFLVKTDDLVGVEPGSDAAAMPDRPPACSADLTNDPLNCGACGRSCLGTACVESRCLPHQVATDQERPLGIAVTADFVYWVNQGPPASLRRARPSGDFQQTLDTPGDLIQPDVFDIAADGENVYWTEVNKNEVFYKPLTGGLRKSTGRSGPGVTTFLVLDGAQIYVAGNRNISGTQSLYMEPDVVGGLAVQGNILFWARQGSGTIVSGPVEGGRTVSPVADTAGRPMGVAVDRDFVYWVEDGLRVQKRSRRGGATITLHAVAGSFGDSDIAVDETWVYWTQQNDGLVLRVPK